MSSRPKIDHAKAMTKAERAVADKERLARIEPAYAAANASAKATRKRRDARAKVLLAIPDGSRTPEQERELDGLMHHEIMVMAGVLGPTPKPSSITHERLKNKKARAGR